MRLYLVAMQARKVFDWNLQDFCYTIAEQKSEMRSSAEYSEIAQTQAKIAVGDEKSVAQHSPIHRYDPLVAW